MTTTRLMMPLAFCTLIACGDAEVDQATTGAAASAKSTAPPAKSVTDESKSSEAPAPAAEPAVPDVPKGPVGLKAEGNNPALVKLAAGMAECDLSSSSLAYNCATLRTFVDALDPEADVGTLINFLEDPSEGVRYLAIYALDSKMILQKATGRAHTDRVLNAAQAETHAAVATKIGENLLRLDFKDEAVAGRIQAISADHAVAEMKMGIFSNLKAQDTSVYVPFMIERFGKETNAKVKASIVEGLYGNGRAKQAEICEFAASNLGDSDITVARWATYIITWNREQCKDSYDAFLDDYAQRVSSGKSAMDYNYVQNAVYFPRPENASVSAEQKSRFMTTSKALVENAELSSMWRGAALEAVAKHSDDGKAYAKKFVSDSDLKSTAERLSK